MVNVWKVSTEPFDLKEFKEAMGLNRRDYEELSKENCFVAIGWRDLGDLSGIRTKEDIQEKAQTVWDERKLRLDKIDEIYSFCKKIDVGDIILHYAGGRTIFNVGRVVKPKNRDRVYYFISENEDKTGLKGFAPHRIDVEWLFGGNPYEADFHLWQDTVHKVERQDILSKIKDEKLRNFLLREIGSGSEKGGNGYNFGIKSKKQIILCGPPGTGKTYNSRKRAVDIVMGDIDG